MANEIKIRIESTPAVTESVQLKTVKYDNLTNKPKINGVELVGDKSTADLGIEVDTTKFATKDDVDAKQDKLTAGDGITIDGNTISASGGGGASLPDQTDNAGKFLTTDGTTTSWSDALKIDGTNVVIGSGAQGSIVNSMAIGFSAKATMNAIAIGRDTKASPLGGTASAMAIGNNAQATGVRSIAIGFGAIASGDRSIQLGNNWQDTVTNADPNTFKVANDNGNFEMMDANGNVPLERLTYVTNQIGDISTALTAILGE